MKYLAFANMGLGENSPADILFVGKMDVVPTARYHLGNFYVED